MHPNAAAALGTRTAAWPQSPLPVLPVPPASPVSPVLPILPILPVPPILPVGSAGPQRSSCDLAMIESRRAIELRDDRRQFRPEPPFIRPAPSRLERVPPTLPPGCDEPGQRLDDEHAIALRDAGEDSSQQHLPGAIRQFVHGKRRHDARRAFRERRRREIRSTRTPLEEGRTMQVAIDWR